MPHDEQRARLVLDFIRAGWNPPRPDDRITDAILDDIFRVRGSLDLSPIQQRILELLAEGKNRDEMAQELGIHFETLRTYQKKLYRRLGAKNGPHAIAIGFRKGYLA